VVGRLAAIVGRLEGAVDEGPVRGTVAVVATSCPRVPQQHRDVVTVPAWCGSGGDGRTGLTATGMTDPAGLTSRRGPV
jgi:hypothetical protein